MKFINPFQLLLPIVFTATNCLQSSIVASYDFSVDEANQSPTALAVATDMSAPWSSNFMGNVITGAFRDAENTLIQPTIAEALSSTRYVSFTLTPTQALDFTSFEVTLGGFNGASSTDYTVGIGVFSDLTGFTEAGLLGQDSLFIPRSSNTVDKSVPLTINLSTFSALQGTSSPVEFRIYMLDDRSSSHSAFYVRVRDITVEAVAAVPEPSVVAVMLGFAALGMVLWRRKGRTQ